MGNTTQTTSAHQADVSLKNLDQLSIADIVAITNELREINMLLQHQHKGLPADDIRLMTAKNKAAHNAITMRQLRAHLTIRMKRFGIEFKS